MILSPIIPDQLRNAWRFLKSVSSYGNNPIQFLKYLPTTTSPGNFQLNYEAGTSTGELPVPPSELWLGYGSNAAEYLDSGRADVTKMLSCLSQAGWNPDSNTKPVLDLGCGGGRMIRHLEPWTKDVEVWGMDISAPHINWLKTHLCPPFNFAVNTTIPHLPFSDGYFGLIYCGSLFTHIDDLAESWFLELRRVLAPGGVIYCTLHDADTLDAIKPENPLYGVVNRRFLSNSGINVPDIVVEGADSDCNVFYGGKYIKTFLGRIFDVRLTVPRAYGYQSAWILAHR